MDEFRSRKFPHNIFKGKTILRRKFRGELNFRFFFIRENKIGFLRENLRRVDICSLTERLLWKVSLLLS